MTTDGVTIIEVDALPEEGEGGVWYYYQYNYYYWNGTECVLPDRTDGTPGGGGTAENPAPPPTNHPPR